LRFTNTWALWKHARKGCNELVANLMAFLAPEAAYESVLAGAPPGFDLLDILKSAKEIRIGVAFGRMSGWQKIASALTGSKADRVFVLLGQAFFQTEPSLVLELRKLAKESAKPIFQVIQVRLASATVTFHAKVWIIDGSQSVAIVGSGNLTAGGLADNVECGLYTAVADHVTGLREWFDEQWKGAPPLEESCEKYIKSYQKIQGHAKLARAMIEDEIRILSTGEVKWRRNDALLKAKQYWMSHDGKQTVADRVWSEIWISVFRSRLRR
jgi:HKD family nuclease